MTDRAAQAPLFVDSLALCQWLCERQEALGTALGPPILAAVLDLYQTLTLALKDRDRDARIEAADEMLIRLRALLRLAVECGRLSADQYGYVLGQVNDIGRQIGAWQHSLGAL